MKIKRRGARADNGEFQITLPNPKVTLDGKSVLIKDNDIKDFSAKGHHDYTIEISLEEFGFIVDSVGAYPDEIKKVIGKSLESNLKSLLRIVQSCVDA